MGVSKTSDGAGEVRQKGEAGEVPRQREQHGERLRGNSELGRGQVRPHTPGEELGSPGGREGWATRVHSHPPCVLLHSQQKTELPVTENVQTIPPPYVVRTILVYSRPPCQPQFSLTEPMKVSKTREKEGCLQPARRWLDTRRDFLTTGAGVPRLRFPESRDLWSWGHGVTLVPKATFLPLQKMFQCPYFFFDVVYIHNGADEKEEEMSWKVRGHRECGRQVDVHGRAPNPPAPALRERRPFSVRAFRASDANPLDYDLC